jgi:putative transposase
MIFGFVAKHRGIWPVAFLCEALGVSRSGFYAWLSRGPSARWRREEMLSAKIRVSFADSDRTPAFAGAGSTARGGCGTTCGLPG